MSDEIEEHGYWGSMRDRFPLSQTDDLVGAKATAEDFTTSSTAGLVGRVKVQGRKNLAVIRSGQDWLDTTPEERALYLETMHPVLIKGDGLPARSRGGGGVL